MAPTMIDENGYYCYVNIYEVMQLPDMFASTALEWLNRDVDPWSKGGKVDSEWYPIQAEDTEQLEAREETLAEGMGVVPGVNTHKRQSLHN